MAKFHYLEKEDMNGFDIKCYMCGKESWITENQYNQDRENGGDGEVCYDCMYGIEG